MNAKPDRKLLVVQVAALGWDLLAEDGAETASWLDLDFVPIDTVFPAVTCTVQASFRTASTPAAHGMVANGLYHRALGKAMFWEQSAGLVAGERIWRAFRDRGGTVAMLFWQQSIGEGVDVLCTPAPIHKHHGGMIQTCHTRPAGLYETLCKRLGGPFRLRHYWGPLASAKAGHWISRATAEVLRDPDLAPGLCLTYLPTLDYDLQRFGPGHPRAAAALSAVRAQLGSLLAAARDGGYDVVVFGDYAIGAVSGPAVLPNLALREAGMLAVRSVGGRLYPVLPDSRAFALCDHEVAHVYVRRADDVRAARDVLAALDGVGEVLAGDEAADARARHPNAGELVILADRGRWLGYPWWSDKRHRPDYATHIDIHNKPGFDPCELFFGWPPMRITQDTSRLGGSHGHVGAERRVAAAATIELDKSLTNMIDLASAVRDWLDRRPQVANP